MEQNIKLQSICTNFSVKVRVSQEIKVTNTLDYCKDRQLIVSIGKYISNGYDQKSCLIQGGILSLILFNM